MAATMVARGAATRGAAKKAAAKKAPAKKAAPAKKKAPNAGPGSGLIASERDRLGIEAPTADETPTDGPAAADGAPQGEEAAPAKKKKPGGIPTGAKDARRRAARTAKTSARKVRRGARVVAGPTRSGIGPGDVLLGTIAVSVLYLLVTNTDTAAGVLGSLSRALNWLRDPASSIPYKK